MKRHELVAILVLLATAWLTLHFSSSAVLFASSQRFEADSLRCSYFTGLGVITREYWYSANGIMGRAACPRVISFREAP